jgi:hypothetical protein
VGRNAETARRRATHLERALECSRPAHAAQSRREETAGADAEPRCRAAQRERGPAGAVAGCPGRARKATSAGANAGSRCRATQLERGPWAQAAGARGASDGGGALSRAAACGRCRRRA